MTVVLIDHRCPTCHGTLELEHLAGGRPIGWCTTCDHAVTNLERPPAEPTPDHWHHRRDLA